MNDRIRKVIDRLEKRSRYETRYESKVPYQKRMLAISYDIGSFYNILLRTMKAKKILEIGTSVGYSTLWFADAALANGCQKNAITTIETDTKKLKRARSNFEKAGISEIVDVLSGDALTILAEMKGKDKFDFVFIDADKDNYVRYFDHGLKLVRKNGIIAADNILFPKKYNSIMRTYVKHVRDRQDVISVTVPFYYGEEISLRVR